MGYSFTIMVADIDEKQIHSEDVRTLPLLIARAKSEALLSRIKEPSILITADQVTLWKEELREKPQDAKEARRYLKTISGTPSYSLNGITVTNTATGVRHEAMDESFLVFRSIPDDAIEKVIASGEAFKWAGAYSPSHPLLTPYIERMEGAEGSILGLPIKLTETLIQKALFGIPR